MTDAGHDVDIAILGAGPVGCALALAVQNSGLRVALVGRRPIELAGNSGVPAFRPIALSYASRLILGRIAAWDGLATTPIEQIHVSQSGGFGRTSISREDLGLPALGYVTDYAEVTRRLAGLVDASLFWTGAERPRARLVVHAEGSTGGQPATRDYGHTAIVAAIECDPPALHVAWERFTQEGPLALLPIEGRYGLVWSRANAHASATMDLDDDQFLAELQAAFGRRAGRFLKVGARTATPLVLRYRDTPFAPGEVHIGNAAQTLHPVAGQGLNLGLRDAWDLAGLIRRSAPETLASPALPQAFARKRRLDARATIRATDLLATLYVRPDALSSALRGAALAVLDVVPPARKAFARRMIYGASAW